MQMVRKDFAKIEELLVEQFWAFQVYQKTIVAFFLEKEPTKNSSRS